MCSPARRATIRAEDDGGGRLPISEEAARRVLGRRTGSVRVRIHHDLPVGQGFGMSAAGATATALALARILGVRRQSAIEAAHLADLFGGGGLGGVAAILGGGLELRRREGVPPFGEVEHLPWDRPILIGVVGRPLSTPSLLGDLALLERIRRAGRELPSLLARPSADRFLSVSQRFTDRAGLDSPRVRSIVRSLRRRGLWAAQPMFGESFFAVARSASSRSRALEFLRRRRIAAVEVSASRTGARALAGDS